MREDERMKKRTMSITNQKHNKMNKKKQKRKRMRRMAMKEWTRIAVAWIVLSLPAIQHVDAFAVSVRPTNSQRAGPAAKKNHPQPKVIKIKKTKPQPPQPQPQPQRSSSDSDSTVSIKPWPDEPLVVSNGDYRNEVYLEKHIGGPLYSQQSELPRFPLPTLEQTMETLLPTVLPLARNEDEKKSFLQATRAFLDEAQPLQDRLVVQRQQAQEFQDSSWLQDLWQKTCYLQYREPLSTHVSYYLMVGEDKTLPEKSAFYDTCNNEDENENHHDEDNKVDFEFNKGIARAAAMLVALAESRKQVCSGNMPYETIPHNNKNDDDDDDDGGDGQNNKKKNNDDILCSTGFKYLFHACRIPKLEIQDEIHLHDPSRYKHCIVASHGQFFAVDFVDDNHDPLPLSVLERRLQRCAQLGAQAAAAMAKKDDSNDNDDESSMVPLPQLGWLTSLHRDTWAKARQELLDVGGDAMKEALYKMESAAFVINLDQDEPQTLSEAANVWWCPDKSGANRWMDKSAQLSCTKNGLVGYIGEHSMLDAAPTIPLIRRILRTSYKKLARKELKEESPSTLSSSPNHSDHIIRADEVAEVAQVAGVSNIFAPVWSSSPETLATACRLSKMAKEQYTEWRSQYENHAHVFDGYGKKYLTAKAGLCGQDVVPMAIQLAAFRLFPDQQAQQRRPVATYQAALARTFLHGRTATTRPVSPESHAFCQAMGVEPYSNHTSSADKLKALRQAVDVLKEYQTKASNGMGVDRHLFGLKMMMMNDQDDDNVDSCSTPSLFQDALFQRSQYWRLSTSAVIFCPGFGPVTDDGLGIGFRMDSTSCHFTATSRKENNLVTPFCQLLDEALTEIGQLVEEESSP